MQRLALAVALAAGCAELEPEHAQTGAPISGPTGGGTNSPTIDDHEFHELNLDGLENAEGFELIGFEPPPGIAPNPGFRIEVVHGALLGINGATTISGPALVGAKLLVSRAPGSQFAIRVAGVDSFPTWASRGGFHPLLAIYRFEWSDMIRAPGRQNDLCKPAPDFRDNDTFGMSQPWSVVFEGDRINAAQKTDYAVQPRWFNIGCAGHALAKLALLGHTEPSRHLGFPTELDQRQTVLKMLAADYCGDGTPFTVSGQPLQWQDRNLWVRYATTAPALEARWSPRGAVCLNRPRLDAFPYTGKVVFAPKGVEHAIATRCRRPPPCTNTDPNAFDGAYLVSANP